MTLKGPVRVFIGTDEYQMIGAKVLAHTLRRTSSLPLEIHYLSDYRAPEPSTPELKTKTGFSFTRFLIPEICGYEGRAIYLDADMLVFSDIAELWSWPMDEGVSLLYARQPEERGRKPQYSVFVVDCARARWDARALVNALDAGKLDYRSLVYEFDHMASLEKSMALPFRWNALEFYEAGETSLIHFTDMNRQPWVEPTNPNGHVFYAALRSALDAGNVSAEEIRDAVSKGYVHPALPAWVSLDGTTSFWRDLTWPAPYFRLLPAKNRLIARLKRVSALRHPGR